MRNDRQSKHRTLMLQESIIMDIMEQKRKEMKKEFLKLTPFQRIKRMNTLFNEVISLKAKTKDIKEYEVYRRYLKPR